MIAWLQGITHGRVIIVSHVGGSIYRDGSRGSVNHLVVSRMVVSLLSVMWEGQYIGMAQGGSVNHLVVSRMVVSLLSVMWEGQYIGMPQGGSINHLVVTRMVVSLSPTATTNKERSREPPPIPFPLHLLMSESTAGPPIALVKQGSER